MSSRPSIIGGILDFSVHRFLKEKVETIDGPKCASQKQMPSGNKFAESVDSRQVIWPLDAGLTDMRK